MVTSSPRQPRKAPFDFVRDSLLEGGVTSELVSGIRVQALILAFYSRPYTRAHARARAATKIPPL